MRRINYFGKELSIEEFVKKEICKNSGTQSVAFKENLISLCESIGVDYEKKWVKQNCLICS